MIKTIKPATELEIQAIYNISAEGPLNRKTGPGCSIWFDDRWVGGIFFEEGAPYIGGAVIPEIQGSGQWIEVWPELITWAHEQYDSNLIMFCKDQSTVDLMVKLGAYHTAKEYPEHPFTQVMFNKSATMKFLADNPNLGK